MRTSSAKAKGRRLQQHVAERLRAVTGLTEEDIKSTPMGTQGADLWLSSVAYDKVPYSFECKNQEAVNVWKAFEQARSNTKMGWTPALVIARNRTQPLVVLDFEDFLEWLTLEQ